MITINELSLPAFFMMVEVLNRDQYEGDGNDKKKIKRENRTEEFIFSLYREIVGNLCIVPRRILNDDTFVELCIDELSLKYSHLVDILNEPTDLSLLESDSFDMNGVSLTFDSFDKWTFNKWVTLENAMRGQFDEQGNKVVLGHSFVLPICFGEWMDSMPNFNQKYDLFNNQLLAIDVLPCFARVNAIINALKGAYDQIYADNEQQDDGTQLSKHVIAFGWQEVLRDLADKRVFGSYLDLKKAPLLEVLEYMNCSISKESARTKDFIDKQRKNTRK